MAEVRLVQKNGEHFYARLESIYVEGESGADFCRMNMSDVTLRKKAEIALAESEERFQSFMNNSPATAWMKDEKGCYVYLSAPAEAAFGVKREECLGKNDFEIFSNTNGIIINRRVNTGDHIDAGTILFDVADLSNVWVLFDAYESDLPFLKVGDKLTFTVQALPGITYSGKITFIDPVVDPVTRVSKVRVEIKNISGQLKPEMFATGIVNANLQQYSNEIVIPRSAVLWTGNRSIVYVKQPDTDEPVFKMREVELGPSLGNSYVVLNGLNEGEEIVTQGTFSVDASAQLQGKPSMMNQEIEH
jgi:RND family efflux transporter MFP subunit